MEYTGTTAGYKNSFAYSKNIELLIRSVLEPDEVMVMGGTYKVPIKEGLGSEDFIDELKLAGTYNEDSFEREYMSYWSGGTKDAFFDPEKFDQHRVLKQPEYEYSGRSNKSAYYVLGVDVGRFHDLTEIMVFKVTPQAQGTALKTLVNLYTIENTPLEQQAIILKKLFYKYKTRVMAIDGAGVGAGLVDALTTDTIDPDTGDIYPNFGVLNDEKGYYKKQRTINTEVDALYVIKASSQINSEAYAYAKTQIGNGKIKFLIDEAIAKASLLNTKVGQNMTQDQRSEALKPFVLTSSLKAQMMNLVSENEGVNIILKQSSRGIPKDKVSAFIYGLYYIHLEEEKNKKRKRHSIVDMMFFS